MAFNLEVVHEIISNKIDKSAQKDRLFGMLICYTEMESFKSYTFENTETTDYFLHLLGRFTPQYAEKITLKKFTQKGKHYQQVDLHIYEDIRADFTNMKNVLVGIFLASGIFSEPEKEYRFEIQIKNSIQRMVLSSIFQASGYNHKFSHRGDTEFLYVKDSHEIEDLLVSLGASNSSFELMNIKIFKEYRNKANRISNCETANITKMVNSATEISVSINKIYAKMGEDALPEELRVTARLRLEHPEMSLSELAKISNPPISKSGLNHRLKKLQKIADELE